MGKKIGIANKKNTKCMENLYTKKNWKKAKEKET